MSACVDSILTSVCQVGLLISTEFVLRLVQSCSEKHFTRSIKLGPDEGEQC
jgi:hypothetical protein